MAYLWPTKTQGADLTTKLDTVIARDKLKPRREPYWHRLDSGCAIGFRKMTTGSVGSWIARYRNADTGERSKHALGDFSELPASERFGAAKRAAEVWFSHLGRGGAAEVITVKTACENYVTHVRADKGDDRADDIKARFARWVDGAKIGKIALPKLTRTHVEQWRKDLAATPVVRNPHAAEADRETRTRALSTVNRDMSALRAALNYACDTGAVTCDTAWRVALRPLEGVGGRRNLYLDRGQRKALIADAPTDLAALLTAVSLVPLRPGALAAMTAASFDARLGVLVVGKDKAGADRRIKLPTSTADFFKAQAKDKLPAAPLVARADGKPWTKDSWKGPLKDAAATAGLPAETVVYSLRHSAITDLVIGGLDLLTVAQLSGTSVAMIEKHYGHLREDRGADALARLAL